MENQLYINGSFSITMLNYQRVTVRGTIDMSDWLKPTSVIRIDSGREFHQICLCYLAMSQIFWLAIHRLMQGQPFSGTGDSRVLSV